MKKVLLVGSSFSAAPIFFSLKKRGFHVTVCGALPQDPCHAYADASVYIDYSDREKLLAVVQKESFDYLVPTCNDYAYLSSAWVAEQFGFPGFDSFATTEILHTKKLFRDRTAQFDFPAPRRLTDASFQQGFLTLPCLVKPVDSFSGRGIHKVTSWEGLAPAIEEAKRASRSGEFVVEEFVQGALHSHSAFVSNQKIHEDFFVDEFCTTYPYQVNCSNHPSRLSDKVRAGVRAAMSRLAAELGMVDGLLHTQFIAEGDNFWIIECMRRCPGDLYGSLVERSTGVDYTSMFVQPFVNEPYMTPRPRDADRFMARHTISTAQPLVNFSFVPRISAEELEIIQLKSSGEKLAAAPFDKLAILLARFSSQEAMLEAAPLLASQVSIQSL